MPAMNRIDTADGVASSTGEWFRAAFDRLYPLIYRHRDAASARREIAGLLDVLRELGLPADAAALDIACGAGRHLAAMCASGLNAFGVDLSAALLNKARHEAPMTGRLIRGDVRRLPFAAAFDLATNLFTSFGYFDADEANAAAMRQMLGVLKPGGLLVIDHANRRRTEATLVPRDVQTVDELRVDSRRAIEGDRVVKRMTITDETGRTEQITESVRLYEPDEMAALLGQAGADVARVMGTIDGRPFDADSERMIVVGRRR